MRRALLVLAWVSLLGGLPAAAGTCDDPFAPGGVVELHLRLPVETWDALRSEPSPGLACDAQYPKRELEFRCGDAEPWIRIAARHKRGDQRGVDVPQKPPLKLDFNAVVKGQRWPSSWKDLGLRKLSLNNGQANLPGGVAPALISEGVAWELMAEELPLSSRVGWARLTVHLTRGGEESVEYRGVYLMIEDLDRTQLRARTGSSCGALLKTTVGRCREEVDYDDGSPSESRPPYDAWLATEPGPDWLTRTSDSFDLESLLTQEAIRDVLGSGQDSVMGERFNNYYRFEPRVGRVQFAPWDLDWAFDVYPLEVPPETPLDATCSPIGKRTRCHPELRKRYLARACALMQGSLSAERLLERWSRVDALIRTSVADEQIPVWGDRDPLQASVEGSYQHTVDRMQWWIPQRIAAIRAQAEAEGVPCAAKCESGATRACRRGQCSGQSSCEQGVWSTCATTGGEERCNGLDDDCDGVIDEGCELPEESCEQGPLAARADLRSCGCGVADGAGVLAWVLLWARRWLNGSARAAASLRASSP